MRGSRSRRRLAGVVVVLGPIVLALAATAGSLGASGSSNSFATIHTVVRSESGALPVVRRPASATATWCGTPNRSDLTPNMLGGHPVHWIYAIPRDGSDRLSTVANLMQTDAESIEAWWRREDPLRVPRNDLTQLSCGAQLDLSILRMEQSSSALASQSGRFGNIFTELVEADFGSFHTKYIVYFDGAVANNDVCGQGGSDGSGFGLAIVYVQACPGISTAAIAAHELLHTFGAVPRGAPHDCPQPNDAHTCDNVADLMHPFLDEEPLEAKFLDPGRDDYYGHGSSFGDSQDAPWLVQLDRQVQLPLTITGPGSVTADVPGLDCARTCTTTWNASTRLELTGAANPGYKLVRWGGCNARPGSSTCNMTASAGSSVSALFAPLVYRLRVSIAGKGTVRSSRSGITCRPRCSATFPSYVPLRLTATPAKGWKLRSWAGACRGSRQTCTLPMTAATSARAVFVRRS
jgi:hypothetical protein